MAGDKEHIRLHAQHPLPTILRVTSKRRVPEFLTFKVRSLLIIFKQLNFQFGHELPNGESKITRIHCFLLDKSGDCATAIKQAMHKLGVLSSPSNEQKPSTPETPK